MSEIGLYIARLSQHLLAFLAGGVVLGAVSLVERIFKPLPWGVYVAIALLGGLVCASFGEWQDAHEAQIKDEAHIVELQTQLDALNMPQFACRMIAVSMVPTAFAPFNDKNSTMMFVEAEITNTGAPSIAKNFQLTLSETGITFVGHSLAIKGRFVGKGPSGIISYDQSQLLQERANAAPILRGGRVTGVAIYYFQGLRADLIGPGSVAMLHIADVYQHQWQCGQVWSGLIGKYDRATGLGLPPPPLSH
jgi:hypothetical protein